MDMTEKLKTAATGMTSNAKTGNDGGEKPTLAVADLREVRKIIDDWPTMAKKSAEQTIDQYGNPNEATQSRLIWYNNGPWKRTIVYRDEVPHDFPQPHTDVIENFIDYQVPNEKFNDLARFDGSVIVERTKGEVSARCDMEAANILALNLMHDIVTDRLTVEQARRQYGESMAAFMVNRPAPYTERLQFQVPHGETGDRDESVIGGPMMHQAKEKAKDLMGKNP
jgi:hypothetical protein